MQGAAVLGGRVVATVEVHQQLRCGGLGESANVPILRSAQRTDDIQGPADQPAFHPNRVIGIVLMPEALPLHRCAAIKPGGVRMLVPVAVVALVEPRRPLREALPRLQRDDVVPVRQPWVGRVDRGLPEVRPVEVRVVGEQGVGEHEGAHVRVAQNPLRNCCGQGFEVDERQNVDEQFAAVRWEDRSDPVVEQHVLQFLRAGTGWGAAQPRTPKAVPFPVAIPEAAQVTVGEAHAGTKRVLDPGRR